MSKKHKTAWDSVPKEERKKTISKGVVLAVIGVLLALAIDLIGIFNPMAGITIGEPEPEIDIHNVATWQIPEGAQEKNVSNSTASECEAIIKYDVEQGQKFYYMAAMTTKEWDDIYNDENLSAEKQADGSTIFWWKGDMYDIGAVTMSPDGETIIDISITDTTGQGEYSDDKEFKDFVYTIKWK